MFESKSQIFEGLVKEFKSGYDSFSRRPIETDLERHKVLDKHIQVKKPEDLLQLI